ncbi:hypothetical protein ARSEF1564_004242 [Beauveria bassiana]
MTKIKAHLHCSADYDNCVEHTENRFVESNSIYRGGKPLSRIADVHSQLVDNNITGILAKFRSQHPGR